MQEAAAGATGLKDQDRASHLQCTMGEINEWLEPDITQIPRIPAALRARLREWDFELVSDLRQIGAGSYISFGSTPRRSRWWARPRQRWVFLLRFSICCGLSPANPRIE
jgi:hypothetical protein